MARSRRSILLAASLILLAAGAAVPFVLLSPPRTWNCPATYIVDSRGLASIADADGGATAAVKAIASTNAWNGAGAGRVLRAAKGNVAGLRSGDGVPMISFTDPLGACTGSCISATFHGFSQRSPGSGSYRTTDADIVFNSSGGTSWTSEMEDPGGAGCSGEIYVEGFLVHEVGHTLSLGHTTVAGATMFPSVSVCNNSQATTEADDEAGLRSLYGTSPCSTCNTHTEYLGVGESDVQPCAAAYRTAAVALHEGWLEGPATADFDLYLERFDGTNWILVASSTTLTSSESISFSGTAGTYRYRAVSRSGTGTYHFWERHS